MNLGAKQDPNNENGIVFFIDDINNEDWDLLNYELELCVDHANKLKNVDFNKLTKSIQDNVGKLRDMESLNPEQFSDDYVQQLSNPDVPKIILEIAEMRLKTTASISYKSKSLDDYNSHTIDNLTEHEISVLYGLLSERTQIYFTLVNNPNGNDGINVLKKVNKELFDDKDRFENHPLLKEFVGTEEYRKKKMEILELMMTKCYSWEKMIAECLSVLHG